MNPLSDNSRGVIPGKASHMVLCGKVACIALLRRLL